ncbi:MAG: hypothetical protein WKF47_19890 [Geodermatophilaceae bacterium]
MSAAMKATSICALVSSADTTVDSQRHAERLGQAGQRRVNVAIGQRRVHVHNRRHYGAIFIVEALYRWVPRLSVRSPIGVRDAV